MTTPLDLFVIGAGSGGIRAARTAAARGAKVAVAEDGSLGGTCVNRGCIPKKLYAMAALYADDFTDAAGFGWRVPEPQIQWDMLRDRVLGEVARLNGIYRGLLDSAGATLVTGHARLVDPNTVVVRTAEGERSFQARQILVATGAIAEVPEIPGKDLALISDQMFDLEHLPSRLVVVGGGYIACEFATIFARRDRTWCRSTAANACCAASTTRWPTWSRARRASAAWTCSRPQGRRARAASRRRQRAPGRRPRARREPRAVRHRPAAAHARHRPRATGREAARQRRRGWWTARSAAPCRRSTRSAMRARPLQLTPVALGGGHDLRRPRCRTTGDGAQHELRRRADGRLQPAQRGQRGPERAGARQKYAQVEVYRSEFRPLRAMLGGRQEKTFMKLVVDVATDRVVGAHMVGRDAGEIIQGVAIALKAGATKAQFDATIGIHPTVAEEFVTMRDKVH